MKIKFIKKHIIITSFISFLFLLMIYFLFFGKNNFFDRFIYELKGPFTWDTTMYYAIGKGFCDGLKPYQDLFETKPPMIFFVASLSYALTGNYYLCNILSFLLLLITSLIPVIFALYLFITRKTKNILFIGLSLLTLLLCGLFIGGYDQLRSGEVQVELFGSSFICLYFLMLFLKDDYKLYSWKTILSSLFLMIGIMFKEPFLLVAFFGGILLCQSIKDVIYKVIIPFIYGGVLGILLLVLTGTFIPYVTIYLPHMLSTHINIYGSPFERMWDLNHILNDISNYSSLLTCVLYMCFVIAIIGLFIDRKKSDNKIINIITIILIPIKVFSLIYLSSFAVGLGGQYFNHHHIFAFPMYILFILYAFKTIYGIHFDNVINIKINNFQVNKLLSLFITGSLYLTSLFGIGYLGNPDYRHYEHILSLVPQMKEDAKYVDDVMDIIDEDYYLFMGFNGPIFYAYTKTNPLGPVFFQDPNNFNDESNFFVNSFKKQLEETNIIIYQVNNCGVIKDYVSSYIKTNFTTIIPNNEISDLEVPNSFNYLIYYRIIP